MRKTVLLLASVATALLLASGVVLAATISCPNRDGNRCVGTPQGDTMMGTDRADGMRGLDGNDALRARGGTDRLLGGLGNDTLSGAAGRDTYLFGDGWGQDRITGESGGIDTLDFSALSENGLHVSLTPSASAPEAVFGDSMLNFPSTAVIEDVVAPTHTRRYGYINIIEGNNAANHLFGSRNGDDLYGQGGNDTLLGGGNQDVLDGGAGNDTLSGEEGPDEYYFSGVNEWGDDTIIDYVPDQGRRRDQSVNFGFANITTTGPLIIDLVSRDDQDEVTLVSGASTINWANDAIVSVWAVSRSDDEIEGNPANNAIASWLGNDTISAGEGDDLIRVADDDSGDTVDCGEPVDPIVTDEDRVVFDPGDTISANCEIQRAR
jgi:Ca2+-binding RTX toxin-like protein